MHSEAEVTVVGGGVIGLLTGLELARRGADVLVLERSATLDAGCSSGSAGLVAPSHASSLAAPAALRAGLRWMLRPDSPFSLRPRPRLLPWIARYMAACTPRRSARAERLLRTLLLDGLERHQRLAGDGLDSGLHRDGILDVYEDPAGFERAAARAGPRATVLGPAEARRVEPALGPGLAGAVWQPDQAWCDPAQFMRAAGRAAADAGAEVVSGVEARAIRVRGGRATAVESSGGEVRTGAVVLAAGVWTAALAAPLGMPLPIEGGKGYHVDLGPGPAQPRVPVYLQEARVVATPLDGSLRLAGTLELTGLDGGIDRRRAGAVHRAGTRALPSAAARPVTGVWAGIRPCTPDDLPVLGTSRRGPANVAVATGHGMRGLALAPLTAAVVARVVAGEPAGVDLAPFSPDRFRLRRP